MSRLAMFLALAGLVVAGQADAKLFFADGFDYPDGELTINDGTGDDVSGGLWVPHSGETFDDNIDVIGGQAELLNSGSEDAHRDTDPFEFAQAGDKWYYAATVTVNDRRADPSSEGINNDYFMHFYEAGFGYRGRAYVDDPNVAATDKFTFGLSATSGGQTAAWPSDFDFGSTHKIIVSYDFDSGETEMWVDPVDENSPSIVDSNGAGAMTFIHGLAMRQDFISGTPNNQILVDEVCLADDFSQALTCTPEPSTLALTLLGAAAALRARRGRRG